MIWWAAHGSILPVLQAARCPRKLVSSLRRSIYNPSLSPPPTGTAIFKEFPPETRPHVSSNQFQVVHQIRPNSRAYDNLISGQEREEWKPFTPEEVWARKSETEKFKIYQPASPYAGRSVLVTKDGVGLAYNKLQGILKQNNVRKELRLAERHEKKGVKRRRLRSERWKRKFADEVRKKVKLVAEIRLRDRMWGGSRN